jgi:RHS repeat-associated protein
MSKTTVTGFTGAYLDPVTCVHPLGNGYRWYLPTLMRFNAPDSLSPFGAGGINPYVYCGADPINRSDPTGHMFRNTEYVIDALEAEADRTANIAQLLQITPDDVDQFFRRADAQPANRAQGHHVVPDRAIAGQRAAGAARGGHGAPVHQAVHHVAAGPAPGANAQATPSRPTLKEAVAAARAEVVADRRRNIRWRRATRFRIPKLVEIELAEQMEALSKARGEYIPARVLEGASSNGSVAREIGFSEAAGKHRGSELRRELTGPDAQTYAKVLHFVYGRMDFLAYPGVNVDDFWV